jgi:hypothetical protein
MKIETKFDKGENAVIINDNKIITLQVYNISYVHNTINYSFMLSKAPTLMDNDKIIYKDEAECFKSIKELAEYYENKNS